MNHTIPLSAILLSATMVLGCAQGQRTVTTNSEGERIPASVVQALHANMTAEEWLTLHYGEPTQRETLPGGGAKLSWVYTMHTHEHRPDPHDETYTETTWIRLDANGQIVEAGTDSATARDK